MCFQYAFLLNTVFLKFNNMGNFSPNVINFRTTCVVVHRSSSFILIAV